MRDLLRRLQREPKILRRQLFPIVDRFRRWNAVKRVIDFGRRKTLRIKRQHLCRRQIRRVKISFPFSVLKTGRANPRLHAIVPSTINNLNFVIAKAVLPVGENALMAFTKVLLLGAVSFCETPSQKARLL